MADDDDDSFDEKTIITGGIKTREDYVTCVRLIRDGKKEEAMFQYRLSPERLQEELEAWRQREPEVEPEHAKKG